jgi:hypothetical protein
MKWAVAVINLTESPHVTGKSRQEAFIGGSKPNIQQERLLPILCVVLVWDNQADTEHYSNQGRWRHGIYVGPQCEHPQQLPVPGAIRVAVRNTDGSIRIFVTTKYKAVSMGGTSALQEVVARGTAQILNQLLAQGVDQPLRQMYLLHLL